VRKGTFILTMAFVLLLAVPYTALAVTVSANCGSTGTQLFHSRATAVDFQHHTHGYKVSWYYQGTQTKTKNWGARTGWQYATITGPGPGYIWNEYAFCIPVE
jgi:hypothetical protein